MARSPLLQGSFARYLAADFITVTGNWAQNVSLAIVVLDVSGSPLVTGIALSLRQLPLLILGPLVGPILDRYNRARLVAVSEVAGALLAGIFFLVIWRDQASTEAVLALAALAGIPNIINMPGRAALIGDLVPDESLRAATSYANTGSSLGRVVGPGVATVVLAAGGPAWVFLINAISFVPAAALFNSTSSGSTQRRSKQGVDRLTIRGAMREPKIASVLVLVFSIALLVLNTPVILLTLLRHDLGSGEAVYGSLLVLVAITGIVGALGIGRTPWPAAPTLLFCSLAMGIALVGSGMAISNWMLAGTMGTIGLGVGAFSTTASSTLQEVTEPERRGRVMALYASAFSGVAPIGATLAGALTSVLGPRWAFSVCGLSVCGAAVWTATTLQASPRPSQETSTL